MSNLWNDLLTPKQLDARICKMAELDALQAKREHEFYGSRTQNQLRALVLQAWNSNQAESYQVARSYLKLAGA